MSRSWQELLSPNHKEDCAWELFHENSKIGRYDVSLSNEEIQARMEELHQSLPFIGYPVTELPQSLVPLSDPFDQIITARISARSMEPSRISLTELRTVLHYAYGITRDNEGTSFPRPFRTVPSAGALYPLDILFHTTWVEGLSAGLYHYNPTQNCLRQVYNGDLTKKLSSAMVQPALALNSSLTFFIAATFERTVFKYRDRGYRFALIEAGHVSQNINLVAQALGLTCLNIGGYFDREIDDLLDFDGITQSTIYMIALGSNQQECRH